MSFRNVLSLLLILGLVSISSPGYADSLDFSKYHNPQIVTSILKNWEAQYPKLVRLLAIGQSAGQENLYVLQISAPSKSGASPDVRPAVFVSANLEGSHLIGTEASLLLIDKLLKGYDSNKDISDFLERRTVYVAPLLNPDAASAYFSSIRYERHTNARPIDEDLDDRTDEDGPDDLNKDGSITQMRVKDPEGEWIPDPNESRLMKKADPQKGEKGIYKIYTEGIDNDGDGEYNEDPAGGADISQNFPHDFDYALKSSGLWPVSENESIAILNFLSTHSNIALVLNFSSENTFLNMQQTGKASAGAEKVKVPRRYAEFLGLDEEKEYTLQELVQILKGMNIGGGIEITESLVAMMLGLGPSMDIDKQDKPYMEAVQKEYKEGMKNAQLDYPEKRAEGVKKGSFVAYCYFQYGTPVFSSDLWTVPEPKKEESKDTLTVETLKTMSSEDFIALGEDKIDVFLKEQEAPPNFKARMVIDMLKAGQITPPKMAEMVEKMPKKASSKEGEHPESYILKWSDEKLGGKGFVDWAPYKHPTLGDVEIGGFVPFLKTTPLPAEIEKTISFHTDFYIDLMKRLPRLEIKDTQVKKLDDELYQVTVYFTNTGWFPTSTAQGRRAGTSWPIRVQLKTEGDQEIFSGRPVETIPFLEGSGDTKKIEWIIRGKKGSKVKVTANSPRLDSLATAVVLQ